MSADRLSVGRLANAPRMRSEGWKSISVCESGDGADKHVPLIDGGGNDPETIRAAITWILEQWRAGRKGLRLLHAWAEQIGSYSVCGSRRLGSPLAYASVR